MVALSAKTANEIYGARPDTKIHVYTRDMALPLAPPKALPGEEGAPLAISISKREHNLRGHSA